MELVRLTDLLERPFYFYLSDNGRFDLFNNKNIKLLSKKVGCSYKTLKEISVGRTAYGRRFIEAELFKKLMDLSGISPKGIEGEIVSIRRGRSTRPVEVRLPIYPSFQLSLLFAKAIGDGCICSDWRFDYKNTSIDLVEEVIKSVEDSIGKSKHSLHKNDTNSFSLKFSPVIGFILHKVGVPKGYKISQEVKIADWIKNGNHSLKRSFLRGLFDDESCVDSNGKRIIIAFGKKESLKESLIEFLSSIRNLLMDFNIKTGSINFQQKCNETVIFRFGIYGKENIENFKEHINFSHADKRDSLKSLLENYIDKQVIKRRLLKTVLNSSQPITSLQISEICKIKNKLAMYHLSNLAREGRISRTAGSNPIFWYQPDFQLFNKKEQVLSFLRSNGLSAFDISKSLGVNYKYMFDILNRLKDEGLVICDNSNPRIWSLK